MARMRYLAANLVGVAALSIMAVPTSAQAATSASARAAASSCASSRPFLSEGDRGGCVPFLQEKLNTHVDGDFGPKTLAAVKQFQYNCGFRGKEIDGLVGPNTWAGLLDHDCV